MYFDPIPPPKPTFLPLQKLDEVWFKQGDFELVVNYHRELTLEERDLVLTTVCKQLDQRRLKANTQLQLEEVDFQEALRLLVDSLSRLSAQ
jgi:hypothetical protein